MRFRRAFQAILARTRFERDLRDEIRGHIEQRATDLAQDGRSPADAWRQARLEFGAVESYKEKCRDAGGMTPFRPFLGLLGDLTLAGRRLLATPLFLSFAVISLAVGVAVPTTTYSILYELMWKPSGVSRPNQVAVLTAGHSTNGDRWRSAASLPDFDDLRSRQRSFASLAALTRVSQAITTSTTSQVADIEAVTGAYFTVVGVEPLLGRLLQPADEEQGSAVVVLSEKLWRRRFDADRAIVGRVVKIGNQQFDVVGVAPASLLGLSGGLLAVDAWIPLRSVPLDAIAQSRNRRQFPVIGRLGPKQTLESAAAEMRTIGAGLDAEHPVTTKGSANGEPIVTRRDWSTLPLSSVRQLPGLRFDLLMLMLAFLVLLVACTNLSNLLLSRGTARIHEFSVRRALGASRWRLVRELLAESALIVAVAGLATFALTRGLMRLVTMELPTVRGPFAIEPVFSLPAFAVASAALLASMLVFGLEPALALTKSSLSGPLSSEAGVAPARRGRRQQAFIRWQVAISVCFFLVAAVLGRVLIDESRHDPGIVIDKLALASVHFKIQEWDETRARRALDRAIEIAGEFPAIENIAISSGMPFGLSMTPWAAITTPDRPFVKGARSEMSALLLASNEIFRTLGVSIVNGRPFDDRDSGGPRVGVISEYTAKQMFGTRDAVGRQLVFNLRYAGYDAIQTFTVIGVAKDTDVDRLMQRDDHIIYLPFTQSYLPNMLLVARTSGSPADAARTLQTILRRADPDLSTGIVGPAFWLAAGPWVAARVAGALATALGALTLMLAMVGLYGVQAQAVAHRTREVGVRMALGALTSQIERMVLREGFRPVVEGLVLGLFFGTLARAGVRAMLVAPIQVVDVLAIAIVPIPLAIAAFLACYVPARRAARVDPNVALRHL